MFHIFLLLDKLHLKQTKRPDNTLTYDKTDKNVTVRVQNAVHHT